jgi:Spy/CpxP family protein refolding chaperone
MGPLGMGAFGRIPGLTDAQREQMRLVAERYEAELRPLMEQNRTARTALEEAVAITPVDEAAVRRQSAAVAAIDAELALIRAHMNADIATLLTADQQKALQEQRSRMRGSGGPPLRMR